jgi:carboxylate-amine ligase
MDHDEGRLGAPLRQREIEENLWRAIRYGLGGSQIDFAAGETVPTRTALERLIDWSVTARDGLGLEVELPQEDGAARARRALAEGATIADVYRDAVVETAESYAPERTRS